MRILAVIPHFFRDPEAGEMAGAGETAFGSFSSGRGKRLAALNATLEGLRLAAAARYYELNHTKGMVGGIVMRRTTGNSIDIVLAVHGAQHLAGAIDHADAVEVVAHDDIHPKLLGFAAHRLMAQRRGAYDVYAYLEDDIVIADPDFFAKQVWFRETFGEGAGLLQPNRYEIGPKASRVYIDGDLPAVVKRPPPPPGPAALTAQWLGGPLVFERRDNPMSGAFMLSAAQLDRWTNDPSWNDLDQSYVGPLESASILGPSKLFAIYKPAFANAAFLEVRHHDARLSALPASRRALSKAMD